MYLDGCFLKGKLKYELLVALRSFGNNQMYLAAWTMVEVENKDTWTWFTDILRVDLKVVNGDSPL